MRRALPNRAATATSTGRPSSSATGSKFSASRASRYSGSTPAASSSQRPAVECRGERIGAGDALDLAQRPRERRRPLAILGAEVGVARAHRQAVGLAHDRQRLDPHREVEVADHAPDHDRLLGVLLAEVGDVGPDRVEELGDDGGDAAEVLGTATGGVAIREPRSAHSPRRWWRSRRGTPPRPAARRSSRRRPRRPARRRAPRHVGSGRGPRRGQTGSG